MGRGVDADVARAQSAPAHRDSAGREGRLEGGGMGRVGRDRGRIWVIKE